MLGRRIYKLLSSLLIALTLSSCMLSNHELKLDGKNKGPYLIDENRLSKLNFNENDTLLYKLQKEIINKAEKSLEKGPYSVVDNGKMPNGGSPHDYRSLARYWWPNPNTKSGLPYIYRDGKVNPEIYDTDWNILRKFSSSVWNLSLAYYFTGDDKYAKKASYLVKHWFLKKETAMNPHLKFGQAIPGKSKGTPSGIIETTNFLNIIDGISLIYDSSYWSKNDHLELQEWFYKYIDWLKNSSFGKTASNKENNHSTWYEVQINAYALFIGNKNLVLKRIQNDYSRKVFSQINFQGIQTAEVERVNSQGYVSYNLLAIVNMVNLARKVDPALTQNESTISERIREGLDWLLPYALAKEEWPYSQQNSFNRCSYLKLYRKAAIEFQKSTYERVVQELIKDGCNDEAILVYPKPNID